MRYAWKSGSVGVFIGYALQIRIYYVTLSFSQLPVRTPVKIQNFQDEIVEIAYASQE